METLGLALSTSVVLLVLGGCGGPSESACEGSDDVRACATDHYFSSFASKDIRHCGSSSVSNPPTIDTTLEVSLFAGEGINDAVLTTYSRSLQRHFEPNKLRFEALGMARPTTLKYLLSGTESEYRRAFADADLSMTAPEDEAAARRIIEDVMFRELRAFMKAHSEAVQDGRVNMVVVENIISPFLTALLDLNFEIAGMGISASLVERNEGQDGEYTAYDMLDLSGVFTPTLFIAHEPFAKYNIPVPDNIVAHEMGHALGLPHEDGVRNLMYQGGSTDCRASLTQAQVDLMGPFASTLGRRFELPRIVQLARQARERILVSQRFGAR